MTFKEFIDKITELYLYPNLYVLLFKIANEEERRIVTGKQI